MRSILDRATLTATVAPTAEAPAVPKKGIEEPVQLSAFDEIPVQEPAPEQPSAPVPSAIAAATTTEESEPQKKAQKPANNKNRVGSRFDLLTFSDV